MTGAANASVSLDDAWIKGYEAGYAQCLAQWKDWATPTFQSRYEAEWNWFVVVCWCFGQRAEMRVSAREIDQGGEIIIPVICERLELECFAQHRRNRQ